jgi:hypothetical protein
MISLDWKTTYFQRPVTVGKLLSGTRIWLCPAPTVFLFGSVTWADVGEMVGGFKHMRQLNWQLNA